MPPQGNQSSSAPPPPPGYTLDASAKASPPILAVLPPRGYTLDAAAAAQQPTPGWWQRVKTFFDPNSPQNVAQAHTAIDKFAYDQAHPEESTGLGRTIEDVKQERYAGAAHEVIGDVTQADMPLAIPLAVGAPVTFGLSLLTGLAGQKVAQSGAEALGATSDQAALAGDVGAFAGGMAGMKTGKIAGTMAGNIRRITPEQAAATPAAGALQPARNLSNEEVLTYAQGKGIDLSAGQALQTPLARSAEALGERGAVGGPVAEARELAATKLIQNVRDFADRADPHQLGTSDDEAGQNIHQALRVTKAVAHENAAAGYQQLPKDLLDAPVNVSEVNKGYLQALQKTEVQLANRNPQAAASIRAVYDQLSNLGTPKVNSVGAPYKAPEVDFQTLLKLRSDLLQDGDMAARAGSPSEVQGLYRQAAGKIDALAEQTAEKFGATDQWRTANAGWRDYLSKYGDSSSPLYQAMNQADPAKVTRTLMNRASPADVRMLQAEHADPALEALRRQVVTDIGNKGFSIATKGLGNYSDAFLRTLFGDAGTKELYLNAEIGRRMRFQANPSGTSNVILSMEQLTNPKALAVGAAMSRAAMPRPAGSFLPGAGVVPFSPLKAMLGMRALLPSGDQQNQ